MAGRRRNYMDQYLLTGQGSPRIRKLTAAQFMDVWQHYDSDGMLIAPL